jgi:hypothetical protein
MSQDYFLKKTYDTVYKANKAKSPFRSLSESYRLVYESDNVMPSGFNVNELKIDEVRWTPEQLNLYSNTDTSDKDRVIGADETVIKDKNGKPQAGVGPGEYAVASVISGLTDYPSVVKVVQGGSKDFDIEYKSYKFEVKKASEVQSVRIGKHGTKVGEEIYKAVDHILDEILDQYGLLKEEEKQEVNKRVIGEYFGEMKVPRELRKGVKTKTYQEYESKLGWNVEKWALGIKGDRNELPFSLLFTTPKVKREGAKAYISVKKFLEIAELLKTGENTKEEETSTSHVVRLADTFKRFYGVENSPNKEKLDKELEHKAERVDKDLTKQKIKTTGIGGKNWQDFFKTISKENLLQKINKLKNEIDSPLKITELFPSDLTGLFIVSSVGYRYIPRKDLGNYIMIKTVSMGGPKISLKPIVFEHPNEI